MINSIKQKREFLGIKDVTTERQKKNGTVIWQLPIKKHGSFIEVGSFESGYVRRMNGCWTPYQLNKCEPIDHFYKDYKYMDGEHVYTGKYNKYVGKKRILIPGYWDRLEYLMAYCLKNYYINQANEVENGKFIPKWRHEFEMKNGNVDTIRELQIENRRLHKYLSNSNISVLKYKDKYEDLSMTHEEEMLEKDCHDCGDSLKNHNTGEMVHFKYQGGQIENMENGDIFIHEQHAYWNKIPNSVQVIVDGHRYNIK